MDSLSEAETLARLFSEAYPAECRRIVAAFMHDAADTGEIIRLRLWREVLEKLEVGIGDGPS